MELGRANSGKLVLLIIPLGKERKSAGSRPAIKQVCPSMMPACLVPSCSQLSTSDGTFALLETQNGQCPDHACLISGHWPAWPVAMPSGGLASQTKQWSFQRVQDIPQ